MTFSDACRGILSLAFCATLCGQAQGQRLTEFVDPMIGAGGHGHVFVGASVPFGAVQPGPDNTPKGWDWCSGYHYSDSILIGFSQMHLSGTGIGDLGDVLIMPFTGEVSVHPASHYTHATEKVRPGYYSVHLDTYGVDVSLTATERVAFHRYYFPGGQKAFVLVDLKRGIEDRATDTYIEQVDVHTLEGYRMSRGWAKDQRVYFAIRSDQPITRFQVYNDSTLLDGTKGKGTAIRGLIGFDQAPPMLRLKIGISPVSSENALSDIETEIPGWNFDSVAKAADAAWNRELSKVQVETPVGRDKRIFYTALYHTMIDPNLFDDDNGDYRGTDKQVYRGAPFHNYTVFSLWDTYRALQPLYTILQPDRENDLIQSFLAIYRQQGKLPVWHLEGCETNTMPGISSVQVIAEAYLKGYHGFNADSALDAIKTSMDRDDFGLKYDRANRYIPCDLVGESVAKALEYAISSASAALMAKKLGRKDDYAYFHGRFQNYRQYYDSTTGFFRGRMADGSWNPVFDPVKSSMPWINDYSEGNGWEYLWLVPEDVEGLIRLMGGDQGFITRLDSLFTLQAPPDPNAPPDIAGMIGQYAHGDEPGHHTAYLYAYAGAQWKTAEMARYIMDNLYTDSVDNGISGNDDCGQMSAWYVFSSLGFYPVYPAGGQYVLGSPKFDKASIRLPNGKTFTVETVGNGPGNKYIQRVTLDGQPYSKSYLLHDDILRGGVLRITMGPDPNKSYGNAPADRPYSNY